MVEHHDAEPTTSRNNTNPAERLCWHTSGGNINGGWRCGATTGLNNNAQWERKIFHAI